MTYIGKTGKIATVLFKQIPNLKTSKEPIDRRLLFTGPPGVGNTDLAEHLASELTGEAVERIRARLSVNVQLLNGQSCTIEIVRQWQERGIYRPLFGDCSVILVDEIDAISAAALNEIRTYLDRLPPTTIFIATTNKTIDDLQEQLQSRFQVFRFDKVADTDTAEYLVRNFSLSQSVAYQIAKGAKGNVRAAKADAIAWKAVNE